MHVERGVAREQIRVGEGASWQRCDLRERRVVHFDRAGSEVRGVEQGRAVSIARDDRGIASCNGESLVDRPRLLVGIGVREIVAGVVYGDDAVGNLRSF